MKICQHVILFIIRALHDKMTEWQIKKQKKNFHARIILSINLPQITQMNIDYFLWGHGDKYSAHGCYFWKSASHATQAQSISRPCTLNSVSVSSSALEEHFRDFIQHGDWRLHVIVGIHIHGAICFAKFFGKPCLLDAFWSQDFFYPNYSA